MIGYGGDEWKLLDLSGFSFPSDRISIGMLRQRYPDLFDHKLDDGLQAQPRYFLNPDVSGSGIEKLGSMMFCERMVAAWTYATAVGIVPPRCNIVSFKKELVQHYQDYGVAEGEHAAAILVQNIEGQARQWSKRHP